MTGDETHVSVNTFYSDRTSPVKGSLLKGDKLRVLLDVVFAFPEEKYTGCKNNL